MFRVPNLDQEKLFDVPGEKRWHSVPTVTRSDLGVYELKWNPVKKPEGGEWKLAMSSPW